jgi:4a-hydroxytetrahydrobiopterin dehydratase
MGLEQKKCVPCEGGVPKLGEPEIQQLLQQVHGWQAREEKLHKSYTFKDFVQAVKFINRLAEIAEGEGHHPDFCVHYNRIEVTLWTHAIDGLSENDFILAAKLDTISV